MKPRKYFLNGIGILPHPPPPIHVAGLCFMLCFCFVLHCFENRAPEIQRINLRGNLCTKPRMGSPKPQRGTTPLPTSPPEAPPASTLPVNPSLVNPRESHSQQLNDSQMAPAFHEPCSEGRGGLGVGSRFSPQVIMRRFCIQTKLQWLTPLTGPPCPHPP